MQSPAVLPLAPGLVARAASYAPWLTIARHEHPWAFIALVTSGVVDEICEGRRDVRGAGAVRIMPPGVAHANRYREQGAQCFITELHIDASDLLSSCPQALAHAAVHEPGTPVAILAGRMFAEFRTADDLSPLAIDGYLRQLLASAAREARHGAGEAVMPPWLLRVRDRVHDAFPAAPSLQELAAEAGVHPSHLVRVFRRHFHCAPAHYIARLRIERAQKALTATDEPIASIAAAVGFSDQSHFTRRFKTLVGTTPARYRQSTS